MAGLFDDDEPFSVGAVDEWGDDTATRSARYKKKREERGEIRVAVWIPRTRLAELKTFVASLQHDGSSVDE